MGKRLFVGNPSYEVDSTSPVGLFTSHGTVKSLQVITNCGTGQSKGFGVVEMGSCKEAHAAIAAMNGVDQSGRAMMDNEAELKEGRAGGSVGGGSVGSSLGCGGR